jgi:hypothetical protein
MNPFKAQMVAFREQKKRDDANLKRFLLSLICTCPRKVYWPGTTTIKHVGHCPLAEKQLRRTNNESI